MAAISTENLELNAQEAQSVSEVIFERIFNDGELAQFHDVVTGIAMKTQIPYGSRIGLLGRASNGCTPNEEEGFALSEKFWEPATENFRLKHCAADLDPLLKVFRKASRMNPDFYDRLGSDEIGVIVSAVEASLLENLHRKIWFSDTAAETFADGGVFKNGTNMEYWNTFNGLFKQIMTDVPIAAANHVSIDKNAQSGYIAQVLSADAAVDIFSTMIEAADPRLLSADGLFILATRSLTENYMKTLRTKNLGAGFLEVVEDGRPRLFFDGIEVITRYDWDHWIRTYQDNGTKWNLPHRAVLTTKDNIPVGTLSEEDLSGLDSFYDKVTKYNYIDAAYTIDAKHLEPYMTVAAY